MENKNFVPRKKAAAFDLDGTLCNTLESLAKSGNDVLEHYGYAPEPVARYRHYAGNGAKMLLVRALEAAGAEDVDLDEAFALYMELFRESCTYKVTPFPGLLDLMQELREAGMTLLVLTNKSQEMAERVIRASYPEGTFLKVAGQQPGVPLKPDAGAPLHLLKQVEIAPEDCFFVGDMEVDMKTGQNAGMETLGVTWGFRTAEELWAAGADGVAENAQELGALLLEVSRG